MNIPCQVSAFEAEEVGVEHLLREIKDLNIKSLENQLKDKVNGLLLLKEKILVLENYLDDAINDKIVADQSLVLEIQRILMHLGKVSDEESLRQISLLTNENYEMLYMNSVVSSVMKLHDFIDNKIETREKEIKA